jgi:hypothetical protein
MGITIDAGSMLLMRSQHGLYFNTLSEEPER